jgi:LytS/YehU family sensor histidine kinase
MIPFTSLLKLLVGLSLIIQIAVISYSHISGYYTLEGVSHFLSKLLIGAVFTLLASVLMAYPNLYVIQRLNARWTWATATLRRALVQFALSVLIGVLVSVAITLLVHTIRAYLEPLQEVLINNALIFSVCNLLLMTILEAWIFFIEKDQTNKRAEAIEREASRIRFEVLKAQINPHFMFNSLNVLSGLIETDHEKAQRFIEEFSAVYRYILETIDQYVVTVEEELRFARSYMYLQQIRYGESLLFTVDLPSQALQLYLPPLSVQMILENVTKHNLVSKERPLKILLYEQDGMLIISNNVQPKATPVISSGLGHKNLSSRYNMISEKVPEYRITETSYEAKLPLLTEDTDESAYH